MTDIEAGLRAAMHAAVDTEVANSAALIRSVQRRHRQHSARLAVVTSVVVSAAAVSVIASLVATSRSDHGASPQLQLPTALSGLPSRSAAQLQVLISTARGVGWYSTTTRHTRLIAGSPRSEGDYSFGRVDGGWAGSAYFSGSQCADGGLNCAGQPAQYYFIADGSLRATRIGAAWSRDGVAPSDSTGAVWLITYPRPNDNYLTTPAYTQLVSTAGKALGPRYRLPVAYWPARGVGRYLLLYNGAKPLMLWDPRTGVVIRRFANLIDAGPNDIAYSAGCSGCRVHILNVSTGVDVTTPIPGGRPSSLNGTFSDDGKLLAVQLPTGPVAVFNTVTGRLAVIPGSALSHAEWMHFGWLGAGHRLVLVAGPNSTVGPVQVAYWQSGNRRLRVATIRDAAEFTPLQTDPIG
jgi:hypothetical protein